MSHKKRPAWQQILGVLTHLVVVSVIFLLVLGAAKGIHWIVEIAQLPLGLALIFNAGAYAIAILDVVGVLWYLVYQFRTHWDDV